MILKFSIYSDYLKKKVCMKRGSKITINYNKNGWKWLIRIIIDFIVS